MNPYYTTGLFFYLGIWCYHRAEIQQKRGSLMAFPLRFTGLGAQSVQHAQTQSFALNQAADSCYPQRHLLKGLGHGGNEDMSLC